MALFEATEVSICNAKMLLIWSCDSCVGTTRSVTGAGAVSVIHPGDPTYGDGDPDGPGTVRTFVATGAVPTAPSPPNLNKE